MKFHYLLRRVAYALSVGLVAFYQTSWAELRDLTDTQGRTIRAEVKGVEGGQVTIEREDGRSFTIGIDRFSEADREYIRARGRDIRNSTPARMVVDFLRTRSDTENDYNDPDDRQVSFQPTVVIRNEDRTRSFENAEVICIIIGESVFTTRQLKILALDRLKGDLPLNETVRLTGKQVTLKYDENPRNGHAHGYRYSGYIVVIRAQTGHLLYSQASRSAWMDEGFAERVDDLRMDVCYDRDLKMEVAELVYEDFY
jgi:hypothetical protein